MERSAGVIMHIASLPGKFGIGTFGKEAYEYVEFLYKSGMRYWQILPLGQTGYGDSPYQSFSKQNILMKIMEIMKNALIMGFYLILNI